MELLQPQVLEAAGVRVEDPITQAQELLAAQDEHRLPCYLKRWQRIDLAIVDELGYLGLGTGGPPLFQFFAERYEKGSVPPSNSWRFRLATRLGCASKRSPRSLRLHIHNRPASVDHDNGSGHEGRIVTRKEGAYPCHVAGSRHSP